MPVVSEEYTQRTFAAEAAHFDDTISNEEDVAYSVS